MKSSDMSAATPRSLWRWLLLSWPRQDWMFQKTFVGGGVFIVVGFDGIAQGNHYLSQSGTSKPVRLWPFESLGWDLIVGPSVWWDGIGAVGGYRCWFCWVKEGPSALKPWSPQFSHDDGSILLWGWFVASGTGISVWLHGTMKRKDYLDTMSANGHKSAPSLALSCHWVFQQENII